MSPSVEQSGSPHEPFISNPERNERHSRDIVAQQEFIGTIEQLRKAQVLELPDLSQALDHQGQRSKYLNEWLQGDSDRVFLAPGFIAPETSSGLPDRVSFIPQSSLRLGRENSYQQVFFGGLQSEWFSERNRYSSQIAIKPIKHQAVGEERLLHEVAMNQYLAKLGISAVEMAGVVMLKEPRLGLSGFSVTKFDPELTTLDTFPWRKFSGNEKWQQVAYGLDTLALLHAHLVFHGDAEFKNIGVRASEGSIKIVDTEWGSSLADAPDNIDLIAKRMSADFANLCSSIDTFVFGTMDENEKPQDDSDRFNRLHNLVYEPYFEKLIHIEGPYTASLVKAYEIMIQQKMNQAYGMW